MPKQKTHKGTKKRFRLSANGKAMHRQSGTSHLATRMDQKRKRIDELFGLISNSLQDEKVCFHCKQ